MSDERSGHKTLLGKQNFWEVPAPTVVEFGQPQNSRRSQSRGELGSSSERTLFFETLRRFMELMASAEFTYPCPTQEEIGISVFPRPDINVIVPIDDAIDTITELLPHMQDNLTADTYLDLSQLRPSPDKVRSMKGTLVGPTSLMKTIDELHAIDCAGWNPVKTVLRVCHPDILRYVNYESAGPSRFQRAVIFTRDFMLAAVSDAEYWLVNPSNTTATRQLPARLILRELVGDQGHLKTNVLFADPDRERQCRILDIGVSVPSPRFSEKKSGVS